MRFSLTHLLMAMALVSIVVAYSQSEESGRQSAHIRSLFFNADGSRIVVFKQHYHRSMGKGQTSRTISNLNSLSGHIVDVIHRQRAVQFPSESSVDSGVLSSRKDGFLVRDLTTGAIKVHPLGQLKQSENEVPYFPCNRFEVSKSGRLAAEVTKNGIAIWDLKSSRIVRELPIPTFKFANGYSPTMREIYSNDLMVGFSHDDEKLVISNYICTCLHVLNIATGKPEPDDEPTPRLETPLTVFLARIWLDENDHVVSCTKDKISRYSLAGKLISSIDVSMSSTKKWWSESYCRSDDGALIAIHHGDEIQIVEIATGKSLAFAVPSDIFGGEWANPMAFSPDNKTLVIGNWKGKVSLIEIPTGKRFWLSDPPEQDRPLGTGPKWAFGIWCMVAVFLRYKNRILRRKVNEPVEGVS